MAEPPGEPPDPWVLQHEFTSKRLNRLAAALEVRSYLEIGVHTGGTFARVQVPERTAVDPAFPFPVADHEDETRRPLSDSAWRRSPRWRARSPPV